MSAPITNSQAELPRVVRMFSNPRAYDHPVDSIEVVETHISWVFLTGAFAYKVKKPVKLPFVDFSTLARRRDACGDEVRLNRRLAPSLYVGVVTMGGTETAPKIHGTPLFEYAVKMRQFNSDLRLDRQLAAGSIAPDQVCAFAAGLAEFHAALPPLSMARTSASDEAFAAFIGNLAELESQLEADESARLESIRTWFNGQRAMLAAVLNERSSLGFVRECHGDLHLENLVLLENEITAFDALEFSERLRQIDLIDEVGFLVMDFVAHKRRDLAYMFLNCYLEETGDYPGLRLITYYMIYRALVRAKVRKIRQHQVGPSEIGDRETGDSEGYLRLGIELGGVTKPLLLITRGLSGSGKTHVSQALIPELPAIRVRSDIERKRLFGLAPGAESGSGLGTGIYASKLSDETYAVLERFAAAALEANLNVIIDASFLKKSMREIFRSLADDRGADFIVLNCQAPAAVLRERVAQRKTAGLDASEATVAVLNHQMGNAEPLDESEHDHSIEVDTTTPVDIESLVERIGRKR